MIVVDDLMGRDGRSALRQDRLARLARRAVPFLRRHFAPLLAARGDAELVQAVTEAVPAAERRGFRSESDIFSYMVAVVLLGHRFETDPQYDAMLRQAGWIAEDGTPAPMPGLALLQVLIDEHLDAVRGDDADLQGRANAFAALYRQNPTSAEPVDIARWMAWLWPARARHTGEDGVLRLALTLHRRGAGPDLAPVDFLALCGLCFRLGHGCLDDPLCGWLTQAVARYGDGLDAGREALGQAIIAEITARQKEAAA